MSYNKPHTNSLVADGIYTAVIEYENYVNASDLQQVSHDNHYMQKLNTQHVRFTPGYTKYEFDSSPWSIYQSVYLPLSMTNRVHSLSQHALKPTVTTHQRGKDADLEKTASGGLTNTLLTQVANSFDPEYRKQRQLELIKAQEAHFKANQNNNNNNNNDNNNNQQDDFNQFNDGFGDIMMVDFNDDQFDNMFDTGGTDGNNNGDDLQIDDLFNNAFNSNNNNNNSNNQDTQNNNSTSKTNKARGVIGNIDGVLEEVLNGGMRDEDGLLMDNFDDIFATIDLGNNNNNDGNTSTQNGKKRKNTFDDDDDDVGFMNLEQGDIYFNSILHDSNGDGDKEHIKNLLKTAVVVEDEQERQRAKQKAAKREKEEKELQQYYKDRGILTEEEVKKNKRQKILEQL